MILHKIEIYCSYDAMNKPKIQLVVIFLSIIISLLSLVGGIPTPLNKMKVNWDDNSQYICMYIYMYGKKELFQTTN